MDVQSRLLSAEEIRAYLDRIGFEGQPDGSARDLIRLQWCHLQHVPYENFDILLGKPLSLHTEDLYHKIVDKRRGGYCFELNALFGALLTSLGYSVTHYFARFWRDEPNLPPKRRHQVLGVAVEGKRFLVDVGVGGVVPRQPIQLVEALEQVQATECYRMDRDPDFGWVLMERHHGEFRRLYSFTEEAQLPRDFIMASYWCEHAPDSIFRQQAMVAIHTQDGRVTLSGEEFRVFAGGEVDTFFPSSDVDRADALARYFGIVLDAD